MKESGFMGALLLGTDEDLIWASGSGARDVFGGTVTPLTTFEIGSATKTFIYGPML